jgi:hypothetical protein
MVLMTSHTILSLRDIRTTDPKGSPDEVPQHKQAIIRLEGGIEAVECSQDNTVHCISNSSIHTYDLHSGQLLKVRESSASKSS